MITHDPLGRRHRYATVSTGKRVTLKPRDMRWLEALRDHGPLPSDYLHAFTAREFVSEKSTRIRLADLAHEANTAHGGPYLRKPMGQQAGLRPLNRPLVYDLTEAGWEALGTPKKCSSRPTGPFAHQLMVSTVTAAIELGCLGASTLRFIPGWQILDRAHASIAVDLRIAVPPGHQPRLHRLIPDQLFALEYGDGGPRRYLSFAVECDRGTEPLISRSAARKSGLRNYLQYRQFVGDGLFKRSYALSCSMVVLNVFTSTRRMNAQIELLQRAIPNGNAFMLFMSLDERVLWVPQAISQELLAEPWSRVGADPVRLGAPILKLQNR